MLNIQTHMDFEGQGRAEKLSRILITLFGIVGLIWGGYTQQFSETVLFLAVGFLVTALITVPPWPFYRRKPLNWQKPRGDSTGDEGKKKEKKK
ncbi:signal peptidase complex subunit 1 [Phlebotomus argentipes]|uniref:signal peptidase complex subunit 1 n=1 Tax=Phlebotomus argentipes TaxID=94469 RepID=UPI002892B251|nr:signal peptidase complex subunit 1 [Phlebotomus argentipes]